MTDTHLLPHTRRSAALGTLVALIAITAIVATAWIKTQDLHDQTHLMHLAVTTYLEADYAAYGRLKSAADAYETMQAIDTNVAAHTKIEVAVAQSELTRATEEVTVIVTADPSIVCFETDLDFNWEALESLDEALTSDGSLFFDDAHRTLTLVLVEGERLKGKGEAHQWCGPHTTTDTIVSAIEAGELR